PALGDFAYDDFAQAEASRLEEERLGALGLLFDAHLDSGRGEAVVAELEALVALYPLREAFRAQLMRALAGSGRRAEALRVYQQGRKIFAEELGLDPSVSLQELERAIVAQDLSVTSGTEREPATQERETTAPASLDRLPHYITSFVGRRDELSSCAEMLHRYRLVTVTGPGGIGKTRLAIELARQLRTEFPDGVFLFELAGLTDPELVALTVANGIGAAVQPDHPAVDTIVRALEGRRCLLVIDNCEHLLEATSRLVGSLLRACGNVVVLATSRERLGLGGEAVWPLPTMAVPAFGDEPLPEEVLGFDAVRLFVERAEAAWPSFRLGADNAATAADICRRLDGIPLALELAAARLTSLTLDQVAARLADRFDLLSGADRTAEPRQQTLRGAIEWSYDLLDEHERALFRRLSVFSGAFDLSAATAVCAGGDVGSARVPDRLGALVEKSLVERAAPLDSEARYRMLETVRQYGSELLIAAGEDQRVRQSHAADFTRRAREGVAGLHGPEATRFVGRLDADHDNLRAALEWLLHDGDGEAALALAGELWPYWHYKDQTSEGIDYLQRAL
ncbi:MAG TPA: BTAD domain-containing putative transcriptional regulator, partial [Candidatus Binatus sp.]|nr:BTAD domain-containing putative transcriptional regulator [Candidatus Binatus sp.]